jgi:iron complex outermembrane receptor protein/vitamin B12 transporter
VDTNLSRFTATLTGTQKFSDFVSLAYGAEWQREEGVSNGSLDFGGGFVLPTSFELTRTSWAPFAEVRLNTSFGLSTQAGVRVDNPDNESSVTSPRVRVAYEMPDSGFTVAGSWGKAFKLPSLYALGHPLVGNPDLNPERGESYELQLSQDLLDGAASWSATWFDGEFRNAIDFDSGPPPMLVNRNRVDSQGIELAGRLGVGEAWMLDASVTNVKSRIASTGGELRNRPEWRAGLGAHWAPTAALKFSAAATYVGTAFDSSIPTGDVELPAYTTIDVSAVWKLSPKFETYLAIDNLTDEQIVARDGSSGNVANNIMSASTEMFVDPANSDRHLGGTTGLGIDPASVQLDATDDYGGQLRPTGGAHPCDLRADEFSPEELVVPRSHPQICI